MRLQSRSFVLDSLVAKESLNTVILNLYPGNKGYSLAFRQNTLPEDRDYDGIKNIFTGRIVSVPFLEKKKKKMFATLHKHLNEYMSSLSSFI